MSGDTIIALDAMGGDSAPRMVIEGMRIAHIRYPDARFILYGDQAALNPLLGSAMAEYCEVRHTDKVVSADDKPSQALRKGVRTSMRLAIDAVRTGEASGVVSAGNTGALMAMSKFSLRTLPGIYRPAIASNIPTMRGESVMLDLGANIQCDEQTLVQFAVMGADFARTVLGRVRPLVGLLNVGEEELKGNDIVRGAHEILRQMDGASFDYHGFVEGNDITQGTVDVIVTDGFTGNVALKTAEGTARLIGEFMRSAFRSSWMSRLGYLLARRGMMALRQRIDMSNYNGGVFLGLNGVAVKSHGGTDANGFANAIGIAIDMVRDNMISKIRADFESFDADLLMPPKAAAGSSA